MNSVVLSIPEDEAKALYRHLHWANQGQDTFLESYRQLQAHFFGQLTVDEITRLLETTK